ARNAQQTVNTYFDKLVSGQMRIRPMPGALASLLREQNRYRISDPGVTRGLELALLRQAKRDSAAGPTGGRLQPAPGGPPGPGPAAPAPPPGPGATAAHKKAI